MLLILVNQKKIKKIFFPINKILSKKFEYDYLLGFLELPEKLSSLRGFVIVTHGLGGSTKRFGLRRISRKLANNGFGVLKLNLRGAGPARYLAKGNYSQDALVMLFQQLNILKN